MEIGDRLRDAREYLGRSIEQAARDTRVRGEYLRALETEDFSVFGGDVYAKGFLSTYARYLELDPGPLLEDYRREVEGDGRETTERLASGAVASPGPGGLPTWAVWGLAAVVVLGGIIALGQLVGGRTPDPAGGNGGAPQPVASPSPTDTAPPTPADPQPTSTASPSPTAEGVNLALNAEQRCWVEVTIDDEVVFSDTLEEGDSESWEAPESITVVYGNPSGVTAQLNGEDLGPVSSSGEVETVTYTPQGIEGETAPTPTATPAASPTSADF